MKDVEIDDPMELVGVAAPRRVSFEMDTETARCLIEEFALAGFSAAEVLTLFKSPNYGLSHRIYQRRGAGFVRDLVGVVYGGFE